MNANPITNAQFDLYIRLKKYVSMQLASVLSRILDFNRIAKILKDDDLLKLSYWKLRILEYVTIL